MAILKFPTGSNVGIAIDGRPPLFINNVGMTGAPSQVALATAATSLRTTVLDLPETLENPVIAAQPAVGRAHIRADGKISVDLRDVMTVTGDEVTVRVSGTVDGSLLTQDLVIPVTQGLQLQGWAPGTHYLLPAGENDFVIPETGDHHLKLYVSTSGFSKAQIEAREGISNANGAWLHSNPAFDGNGALYGTTPALALNEDRATQQWGSLSSGKRSSNWLLFKRGETFNAFAGGGTGVRGESPLHPIYLGAYGTGAAPRIGASAMSAQFMVVQGLHFVGKQSFTNRSFMLIDNCFAEATTNFQGTQSPVRYGTIRNHRAWDVSFHPAPTSGTWPVKPTREQSTYAAQFENILILNYFHDVSGWALGYSYDSTVNAPQPPTQFSHGIYFSGYGKNISVIGGGFCRGALTGIQGRPGIFTRDAIFVGNNLGLLMGGGPDAEDEETSGGTVPAISGAQFGNFSFTGDCLFTWAGQKRQALTNFETARAINVSGDSAGLDNNVIIDAGPGNDGTYAHGTDTSGEGVEPQGAGRISGANDTLTYNWLNAPTTNLGTLSTALLDGTTVNAFARYHLSDATADRYDLMNAIRANAAPAAVCLEMRDWFFNRLARNKPVPTQARTYVFRPKADSSTPGIRWDCRQDWDLQALPGQVAGDSVDLDGHHVNNSFATNFPLVNLSLGGGRLTQFGDKLQFTGDILTGGGLLVAGSGQVFVGSMNVADQTSIEVAQGRFAVTGSLTGDFSMTVRGIAQALLGVEAASTTVASGQRLVLKGGQCRVGFDGVGGGAAGLTLAAGSTLRFETAVAIQFSNSSADIAEFREGTIVTGGTSGFTGRIVWIEYTGNQTQGTIHVDTFTGIPVLNENLIAVGAANHFPTPSGVVARVSAAPTFHIGKIGEFRSGMNGETPTNVASTVTLAGALEVDVSGLTPGSYDLIVTDTVSGTFSLVNITGGTGTVAYTATKVVLTVS